jgi:class 3 adenylate cyclase/CHASE2 domain-containing sensor protein
MHRRALSFAATWLAIATLGILSVVALHGIVPLLRRIELASYDLRLRVAARLRPMPVSRDIVIIGIDDEALTACGAWPWPRTYWADLVEDLSAFGARAIFLDIAFPEPGRSLSEHRLGGETIQVQLENRLGFLPATLEDHFREQGTSPDPRVSALAGLAQEARHVAARQVDTALLAVRSYLRPPDEELRESLALVRRSGTIVAGVATVTDLVPVAAVPRDRARIAARRWLLDNREQPVDALPQDLLGSVGGELDELRLYRELYQQVESQPDMNVLSRMSPELRKFAHGRLQEVRTQVIVDACEAAVPAPVATGPISPDRILSSPSLARLSDVQDQLSREAGRIASRRMVPMLPADFGGSALERAPWGRSLAPPTHAVASELEVIAADNEQKDEDGALRSFPLFWRTPAGAVPVATLALFHRIAGARRGPGYPGMSIQAGPVLELELSSPARPDAPGGRAGASGASGGAAAVRTTRIPLSEGGRLLVHWAGSYESTFSRIPIQLVFEHAGRTRDKEHYFLNVDAIAYRDAMLFRDVCRTLRLESPGKMLGLDELAERVRKDRTGMKVLSEPAFLNMPGTAPRPSGPARRTVDDWYAFFRSFMRSREQSKFQSIQRNKRALEATKDPKIRQEREKRFQRDLTALRRYSQSLDELGNTLREKVAGRICLVGHVASSSTDLAATPFGPNEPKIAAHASVLNTLIQERYVHRPPSLGWSAGGLVDPATLQLPLLVAVCLGVTLVLSVCGSVAGAFLALAAAAGWVVVSFAALIYYGLWLDAVAPVLGIGVCAVGVHTWRARRTEQIRTMFETYVDPRIVGALEENESLWKELGGTEQRVTAFFSNVRDFTGLCEVLSTQQVSEMLADYLSPMTDVILEHGGTRDKYIGDAIAAFFGAPIPSADHALQATLAAVAQQELALELKQRWKKQEVRWYDKLLASGRDLEFRIGLHTGDAKVGNFGSQRSKNYTIIGDAVNLALRLEEAAKEYGARIVASEATVGGLADRVVTRPLDRVVFKGRSEPVTIHEVIGRRGAIAPFWDELLPLYARALDFYYRREFAKARALFDQAVMIHPQDGPSRHHLERCTRLLATPPPPDAWDGRITMTLR